MKFPQPIAVKQLAERFNAQILGDENLMATGINEIHKVEAGDIAFSDLKKYFATALGSAATIIFLNEVPEKIPVGKAVLVMAEPFEAYDLLVREHRPFEAIDELISFRSHIHPSAIIEPNVVIAPNVRIGAYSYIQSNCYIAEFTTIGDHCQIGAGSIIGGDAFYFKKMSDGRRKKWRSGGRVIIENHVDIGAGCTINKGVSGDTIIGEGSKLDCQIHIGHGAVIGKNCLFAAQVGIGGKTIVEDEVILYGQVGIAQNLVIGRGAVVLAKSGVSKSLEGGKTYFGIPAEEARGKLRELAALRGLPDFMKEKKL